MHSMLSPLMDIAHLTLREIQYEIFKKAIYSKKMKVRTYVLPSKVKLDLVLIERGSIIWGHP